MVLASVWFIALVLVWMYMLLLLVTGLSALISGREGDGFFTNLAGLGEIMVSNDPGPLIIMVFVMICLLPVTLIWLIVLLVRRAKGWRTSLWRHVGWAVLSGGLAGLLIFLVAMTSAENAGYWADGIIILLAGLPSVAAVGGFPLLAVLFYFTRTWNGLDPLFE